MTKQYNIHQLFPLIHWPSFFKDWDFDAHFARIASLQGCDVVRASWLTEFEEGERTQASEAMQLLKEANRMIDLLDRDYKIHIESAEVSIQMKDSILYSGETQMELDFFLKPKAHSTYPPLNIDDITLEMKSRKDLTLFVSTTDAEMDLLFENNAYKRKLVRTLAPRFTEAAATLFHQEKYKDTDSKNLQIALLEYNPSLVEWIERSLSFSRLGVTITQDNRLSPSATRMGLMLPKYLLIQQR